MEAACWHCGAIFVPDTSAGLCPHCGHNVRTPFARLRAADTNLVALILFLAFSVFVIRSVLLSMIATAQAWSMFTQKAEIGLHKPSVALNLETKKSKSIPVPLSRPAMPSDWRAIALLSRPRNVFMSSGAKTELVLTVSIFALGLAAVFPHASRNEFLTLVHNPKDGVFGLLWLTFWVYFGISGILEYFIGREILRDGELTTGVLTDWREGRGGISVSYQFWTDSGQRFERHGRVHSKEELSNEKDPLKVFYLPQDPSKSLALCCTSWRLRPD